MNLNPLSKPTVITRLGVESITSPMIDLWAVGSDIFSTDALGTIRRHDAESLDPREAIHPGLAVDSADKFVRRRDGAWTAIASGEQDGEIRLYNSNDHQPRFIFPYTMRARPFFFGDRCFLIGGYLVEVDLLSGKTSKPIPLRQLWRSSQHLAPDGQAMLLVEGNGLALVNLASRKTARVKVPGGAEFIHVAGQRVFVTTSERGPLYEIDWKRMRVKPIARGKCSENLCSFAVSDDGRWGAIGTQDYAIEVWDLNAGLRKVLLEGPGDLPRPLQFCDNGKRLVAYCDGRLRSWRIPSGDLEQQVEHRPAAFSRLAWSQDSRRLATIGSDGLRIWDAHDGSLVASHVITPCTKDGDVRTSWKDLQRLEAITWHPSGKVLAAADPDGVFLLDERARLLARRSLDTDASYRPVAVSPNGESLVSVDKNGRSWWTLDLTTGKAVSTPFAYADGTTFRYERAEIAAPASGGTWWVAIRDHQTTALNNHHAWDGRSLSNTALAPTKKHAVVTSEGICALFESVGATWNDQLVGFRSPDGRLVPIDPIPCETWHLVSPPDGGFVLALSKGVLVGFDPRNGKTLGRWEMPRNVERLAVAPDGQQVAVATRDGTAFILSLKGLPKTKAVTTPIRIEQFPWLNDLIHGKVAPTVATPVAKSEVPAEVHDFLARLKKTDWFAGLPTAVPDACVAACAEAYDDGDPLWMGVASVWVDHDGGDEENVLTALQGFIDAAHDLLAGTKIIIRSRGRRTEVTLKRGRYAVSTAYDSEDCDWMDEDVLDLPNRLLQAMGAIHRFAAFTGGDGTDGRYLLADPKKIRSAVKAGLFPEGWETSYAKVLPAPTSNRRKQRQPANHPRKPKPTQKTARSRAAKPARKRR